MVGAGALVTPLLGFDHWQGVVMVGAVVILIVVTAGMVATTWVQFLKGAMLVVFSAVLTWMILQRGLRVRTVVRTAIALHLCVRLMPISRTVIRCWVVCRMWSS
jgi:cation/acetate symporter